MKALLIIVFICMTATAQSREELHKRYGLSTSETFAARPGVFVTVSYAETGEVCEMIIHPQPLTSSLNYPITEIMASKALNEMIDDLVPMSQRGRLIASALRKVMNESRSHVLAELTNIGTQQYNGKLPPVVNKIPGGSTTNEG